MADAEHQSVVAAVRIVSAMAPRKKVLLVEDEAMIAVFLEGVLTEAGFETATAYGGAAALDLLASAYPRFDAVITDIHLPGTVSGWDIARRSSEISAATGVILMTGDTVSAADKGMIEGSVLHQKPTLAADLIASVEMIVPRD
ncbi:response regulator [Devosia sp. BK]|uniref:response regulator n=1 Tax=Devosia sp. BK TaxID=2871706 RepID=UPI00293B5C20|nr:response regulator [Devosia sp. BK]MDV3251620.1 response regulator [Devosia sp. BK]